MANIVEILETHIRSENYKFNYFFLSSKDPIKQI